MKPIYMKPIYMFALIALSTLLAGCDRRDAPENAPTPQPTSEAVSPPTDPEQPTAPVEGETPDKGSPADPATGN